MARDLKTADVVPLFNALRVMYNAASNGANAQSLTVYELRRYVDLIHNNFNVMKNSWRNLRDRVGAAQARAIIAQSLDPTPVDVGIAVGSIQTSTIAFLTAYQNSIYGSGSPAFTYTHSLVSGLLNGGHSEENIGPGALSGIQSSLSVLAADLLVMAPVE